MRCIAGRKIGVPTGALLALVTVLLARTVLADGAAAGPGAPASAVGVPASYTRTVKTMDEDDNGTRTGLVPTPKAIKGPQHPYAENSFSSASYREKASSELRRMHEQAFKNTGGTNAAASNAVVVTRGSAKAGKDAKEK
ncbi:MAG: hypothetical protein WCI17_04495 [bacterium]